MVAFQHVLPVDAPFGGLSFVALGVALLHFSLVEARFEHAQGVLLVHELTALYLHRNNAQ